MFNFLKKNKFYISIFFITFIFWFLIDENGPFYAFSNYVDVAFYYNIGKMMTKGKELYFDLFDTKGPYMFFIGALSYLLNKSYLLFFILDFFSILLFNIFNFKILKLYFNNLKSFLLSFFLFFYSFLFYDFFGSPEFMLMGIISIFIYWILNDGFNKDNKLYFFIFGIFSSFILLTKINYLLGFGLVAFCYIIYNFLKKRNCIISIFYYFLGLFIGCIPLLIYDFINGEFLKYFKEYIRLALSYSNESYFEFFTIRFFIYIFILTLSILVFYFKSKNTKYLFSLIFIVGVFISILITKRFFIYYFYLIIPFFVFLLILIFKILEKIKIENFKNFICIFSFLFVFVFGYGGQFIERDFFKDINNDNVYQFYNDYKDEIDENSIIIGFLRIETNVFNYFENQPNYKYSFVGNNGYNDFKEIYDGYLSLLKNKEADFVIVSKLDNNKISVFYGLSNTKYLNEMLKVLEQNYTLDKEYFENSFTSKQVYIPK